MRELFSWPELSAPRGTMQAHVVKHNVASIRVLEKCGFAYCAEATGALGEPADGVEEFVYVFDRAESKES